MGARDDRLLAGALGGDVDALSALLKQHGPEVRRGLSISERWRPMLEADDVMQVTYIEAFVRFGQFTPEGPGSFVAWLRQIAENNIRDALRALEREKRPPVDKRVDPPRGDDSFVELYGLLGATTTTPSRDAARQEIKSILERAIAGLPPDYAMVVRLHDLEGKTDAEIAAAMGRSRGAVFMLRARAHDRLRERLGSASQFFSGSA